MFPFHGMNYFDIYIYIYCLWHGLKGELLDCCVEWSMPTMYSYRVEHLNVWIWLWLWLWQRLVHVDGSGVKVSNGIESEIGVESGQHLDTWVVQNKMKSRNNSNNSNNNKCMCGEMDQDCFILRRSKHSRLSPASASASAAHGSWPTAHNPHPNPNDDINIRWRFAVCTRLQQ